MNRKRTHQNIARKNICFKNHQPLGHPNSNLCNSHAFKFKCKGYMNMNTTYSFFLVHNSGEKKLEPLLDLFHAVLCCLGDACSC